MVNNYELAPKYLMVSEGEIRALTVKGDRDNKSLLNATWKSSDSDVVQIHKFENVSYGVILNMLKTGSSVITVILEDGTFLECQVDVEPMIKVEEETPLNYYFGDIHSHTSFSDGKGTPYTACEHALQVKKADFLAITDHAYDCKEKWLETVVSTDLFNDENFVGIPSYEGGGYAKDYIDEYGMKVVNGGEIVYFNTPQILPFSDIVKSKNYAIGMFAHPQEAGWPTEFIWNSFNCFNDTGKEERELIRLIEVVNETSAYNMLHEFSYPLALDKGWKVSPTGVSDTHKGGWTTDYNCRTVILAPRLSRAYIYDAMRNNRVYATEDNNTILSFSINGKMMGSTLDPNITTYDVCVKISDPDIEDENSRIVKAEIISDYGEIVHSQGFDGHNITLSTTLYSNTSRYYYVRAENALGKRTWSTAIWTGRKFDKIEKNKVKSNRMPKDNWKVHFVSSEKNSSASNLFDGDVRLGWETTEPSGEVIIDMGHMYNLQAIGYYRHMVPYEDKSEIGKLLSDYEICVSMDGVDFSNSVARGKIINYGSETYIEFDNTVARYFKFKAISSLGGKTVAIGELTAYGVG